MCSGSTEGRRRALPAAAAELDVYDAVKLPRLRMIEELTERANE